MRPNGSDKADLSSAVSSQRSKLVFDRMNRHITRLAKDPESYDVHRFRTNGRRVEALLFDLSPESRNRKKLLKLLAKLRKKAGKLRDLEVQRAFLENLKIPDRQNHRAQLLDELASDRAKQLRKLAKRFDRDTVAELRKRLRRVRAEMSINGVSLLKLAIERLPNPSGIEIGERVMHAFRIQAKRARYLAELDGSDEATHFVEELKRAQDAIGEWHDVLKLKQKAVELFGGVHDSTLVAALENITRVRFRRARNVLSESLGNIAQANRKQASIPAQSAQTEVLAAHASVA